MATVSLTTSEPTKISTDRLMWAGALTVVLAIATNLVIFFAAESIIDLTGFPLLNPLSIIIAVGGATVLATIIYGLLGRYTKRPTHVFRTIGGIGMLVSFLPIIALMFGVIPGSQTFVVTAGTIVTLAVMHIVSAFAIVGMLTTVATYHLSPSH
jgi:hypothetical protein